MNTLQITAQETQDSAVIQITLVINGVAYPLNASIPVFNNLLSNGVLREAISEELAINPQVTHTSHQFISWEV